MRPHPSGFQLPFEHGAWWTFHSCQAAGLIVGASHGAPWPSLLSLLLSLESLFLNSFWITQAIRGQERLASPAGLGLLVAAQAGALGALAWAPAELQAGLAKALGFGILLAAGVLWMRLKLRLRSRRLLMASAALLSAPASLLAGLGMGFGWESLAFGLFFAWFFAWEVFYVSAWMRGTSLAAWRTWAASLAILTQASLLWSQAGGLLAAALLLFAMRVLWRLKLRMGERPGDGGYPFLPTQPSEIRKLGYEQVAWSALLGSAWTWLHLLPHSCV